MSRPSLMRQCSALAIAVWSLVAISVPHEKEAHAEPFFEGAEHGGEPAHLESGLERPGQLCAACLYQTRNVGHELTASWDLRPWRIATGGIALPPFLPHPRPRLAAQSRAPPRS